MPRPMMTDEMRELYEEVKPFLIKDEFFEKRVPDDAPEGIKEKYEKYNKLYNDACDAAMKEAWMV